MQNHYSNTRKIQRTVTKHLKSLGLKATSKGAKTSCGWLTSLNDMLVSKPIKSLVNSGQGRMVPVLTLNSKG
mgnify:CR=1 FL=1